VTARGPAVPALSAGIIAADLLELGRALRQLEELGVELVHVDVMDGSFCPGLTVGPRFVEAIRGRLTVDVHLLVDEPQRTVHEYVAAGADMITFHLEAARNPRQILRALAGATSANDPGRNVVRGVALKPGTPVEALAPLLDELELVLLLAVEPGLPSQRFAAGTAERIEQVRALTADRRVRIAVDGGITRANIADVAAMGPDLIVAGSAVFAGGAVADNLRFLAGELEAGARRARSRASTD
jgi:ribulose-phosphate 3-epimerase